MLQNAVPSSKPILTPDLSQREIEKIAAGDLAKDIEGIALRKGDLVDG